MLTTAKTDKMATSRPNMTVRDHVVVIIYTLLIWLSIKLAFTPNMWFTMVGWFLLWSNWKSFDIYCHKRAAGDYD